MRGDGLHPNKIPSGLINRERIENPRLPHRSTLFPVLFNPRAAFLLESFSQSISKSKFPPLDQNPRIMKIAIVGSGISGLSAAWLLAEHSPHQVTLYEKNDYLGGHTHTIDYTSPTGDKSRTVPVDTGFIVFNSLTYPNLIRFFKLKNVDFMDSEMSFSVSRDSGRFEWAGTNLATVFAQLSNLFRPGHWRMVYDILKFNHCAPLILTLPEGHPDREISLGAFLERGGYSQEFKDDYLLPMTAAIWSTPPDKCAMDFPAYTLIRFMHNHCLMQVANRPQWYTVRNGSRSYISKMIEKVDDIRLSTPVTCIRRQKGKVVVQDAKGGSDEYDQVVFASHADETLSMLGEDATKEERAVLGGIRFSKNVAVVHCDKKYMPTRRLAWTSWNYLTRSTTTSKNVGQVSLTYWMNNLQRYIPHDIEIFVTLNPLSPPEPALTFASFEYTHPEYTPVLIKAQNELHTIQGKNLAWFAGAWTCYGFHEDGFISGMRIAEAMGAKLPFDLIDNKEIRATREGMGGVMGDLARAFFWMGDRVSALLVMVLALITSVTLCFKP
ncbi:uncharacterized protein VTP21DRAFT_10950 [Calcarisporiella thermophila]|uniref:uncharacterized protein n=1 Tax=Calcarisporiella thermophila TaxID=911321 RepID=UPI0037446319